MFNQAFNLTCQYLIFSFSIAESAVLVVGIELNGIRNYLFKIMIPHFSPFLQRYLQERVYRTRQEIFLGSFRRRYRPYPVSRQHGSRSCLLWYDRHHGPHAFRCTVCRIFFSTCTRRNNGSDRNGKQPDGRCFSSCSCSRSRFSGILT
jgi:hypothetical protein